MEKVIDIEERIPTLKSDEKAYKPEIYSANITFLYCVSSTPLFSISIQ